MATSTGKTEQASSGATAAASGPDMGSGWPNYPDPLRYVHRDLILAMDSNGELQFRFDNTDPAQPLGNRTIQQIVDSLPPARSILSEDGTMQLAPPLSPLDIRVRPNGPPIFIILRIAGPGNMDFNPEKKALSHKGSTGHDRYGNLRHVHGPGDHRVDPAPDCKVIYFACKPGTSDPYNDGLNIRVRLRQKPHLGPPPEPRILDLEIDPDIRFPGGSEVD